MNFRKNTIKSVGATVLAVVAGTLTGCGPMRPSDPSTSSSPVHQITPPGAPDLRDAHMRISFCTPNGPGSDDKRPDTNVQVVVYGTNDPDHHHPLGGTLALGVEETWDEGSWHPAWKSASARVDFRDDVTEDDLSNPRIVLAYDVGAARNEFNHEHWVMGVYAEFFGAGGQSILQVRRGFVDIDENADGRHEEIVAFEHAVGYPLRCPGASEVDAPPAIPGSLTDR